MPALDTRVRELPDVGLCVNGCVLDWSTGQYLIRCGECGGCGSMDYAFDCDCDGNDRDGHKERCSTYEEPLQNCDCASCNGAGGQLCPCDGGRVP